MAFPRKRKKCAEKYQKTEINGWTEKNQHVRCKFSPNYLIYRFNKIPFKKSWTWHSRNSQASSEIYDKSKDSEQWEAHMQNP